MPGQRFTCRERAGGLDPSAGMEVNERYVVLATPPSRNSTAAMPRLASCCGPPGTNSELTWQIQISEEASATESSSRNLVQAA